MNLRARLIDTHARANRFLVSFAIVLVGLAACSGTKGRSQGPEIASSSPTPGRTSRPSLQPSWSPVEIRTSSAIVTRVIDGDTAVVQVEDRSERVRFIGVDSPESTTRLEPYGREASGYTSSALSGRTIFLEIDVEQRDRYGRLLAYIWLAIPIDGSESDVREQMFNARLLLDGFAQLLTVPPNVKYVDMFRKFQSEARDAGKGLWGQAALSNDQCDSAYPDVCIPSPPPDLDCGDIPHRNFGVVQHPDPHGFDRDNDGIGCES